MKSWLVISWEPYEAGSHGLQSYLDRDAAIAEAKRIKAPVMRRYDISYKVAGAPSVYQDVNTNNMLVEVHGFDSDLGPMPFETIEDYEL